MVKRSVTRLDGTANRARDFLVLLILQRAQVLVNNSDRVGYDLSSAIPILPELSLVITQLVKQAFAEVPATHTRRIKLAHDFDGLVKVVAIKTGLKNVSVGFD